MNSAIRLALSAILLVLTVIACSKAEIRDMRKDLLGEYECTKVDTFYNTNETVIIRVKRGGPDRIKLVGDGFRDEAFKLDTEAIFGADNQNGSVRSVRGWFFPNEDSLYVRVGRFRSETPGGPEYFCRKISD